MTKNNPENQHNQQNNQSQSNEKKNGQRSSDLEARRKSSRKRLILALLFLLLFLLLLGVQWKLGQIRQDALDAQHNQEQLLLDSLGRLDSLNRLDSLRRLDSLLQLQENQRILDSLAALDSARGGGASADADAQKRLSTKANSVSSSSMTLLDSVKTDSIAPIVTLIPPPGRYYNSVDVEIQCNEKNCSGLGSVGDTSAFAPGPVKLSTSGSVFGKTVDSAGNPSVILSGRYEIVSGSNQCGKNMMPIPVGGGEVCMDIYEWPNRKGEKPLAFISREDAQKTCEEAGKRLCSVTEWQVACKGKNNWKYPYGNSYNPVRCYTSTTEAGRSGRRPECRSWYGIYDLSGNVWEWTSTPYENRQSFYYVAGGSWKNQDNTGCSETKYSFYPQNKYPFVGFRCCR